MQMKESMQVSSLKLKEANEMTVYKRHRLHTNAQKLRSPTGMNPHAPWCLPVNCHIGLKSNLTEKLTNFNDLYATALDLADYNIRALLSLIL